MHPLKEVVVHHPLNRDTIRLQIIPNQVSVILDSNKSLFSIKFAFILRARRSASWR